MITERVEVKDLTDADYPVHPPIIDEALDALQVLCKDLERKTLHAMLLSSLSWAACALRVQFQEYRNANKNFPNLFTAIYAPSSIGKGFANELIDADLLAPLYQYLEEEEVKYIEYREIQLYRDYTAKYCEKTGKKPTELTEKEDKKIADQVKEELTKERTIAIGSGAQGTAEGIYADAEALARRRSGAVRIFQAEQGLFCEKPDNNQRKFLAALFEAYSNRFEGRSTMGRSYGTIKTVGCVATFLSAPDIIKKNKAYKEKQNTGLGRRVLTIIQTDKNKKITRARSRESEEAKQILKSVGDRLCGVILKPLIDINCFDQNNIEKPVGALYTLKEGLYDNLYIPFAESCDVLHNEIANTTGDELYMMSVGEYPLRALKIATLYAIINHPNRFEVDEKDFKQAIHTVKELDCMKEFSQYRPPEEEESDPIAVISKALIASPQKQMNKTELRKLIEDALAEAGIKGIQVLSRKLLTSDYFKDTIAQLKEELAMSNYSIIQEAGQRNEIFFTVAPIYEPEAVTTTEDLTQMQSDLMED